MSWFGDVLGFEKSAMGDRWDLLKKDPWRAPLGLMDQGSTEIFNGITGKDLEPMVDYYGGATKQNSANAKAKGINTGPGETMHGIARAVTSMFAGGYGADKLGMFGGGANAAPMDMSADALGQASQGSTTAFGSGAPAPSGGTNWMQWARMGSNLIPGQDQQQPLSPMVMSPYRPNSPVAPNLEPLHTKKMDPKTEALVRALMESGNG